MKISTVVFLALSIAGSMLTREAVAQQREIGQKCFQWNEHRVIYNRGGDALTKESADALAAFIKEAGRDCGYRLYATASKEGGFKTAYALAGRRLDSTAKFLRENGAKPELVLPLSHWVDDAAKDIKTARAAIIYTLPKQGISCREVENREPVTVELWFAERSAVISQERTDDLEKLAATFADTRCNIEVTAFTVNEYSGKGSQEKNVQLAKQRAKGITNILTAAGIDADRIVTTSTKNLESKVPNTAANRRGVASLM